MIRYIPIRKLARVVHVFVRVAVFDGVGVVVGVVVRVSLRVGSRVGRR